MTELLTLSVERVRNDMEASLMSPNPSAFFRLLLETSLLDVHFPEVAALYRVVQPCQHHPEGDAFEHTMLCLDVAAQQNFSLEARLMVLAHDLGKALTPADVLPQHIGHEDRTEPVVSLLKRLGYSQSFVGRCVTATNYHMKAHRAAEMRCGSMVDMFFAVRRFADDFLAMVDCDENGKGQATFTPNTSLRSQFTFLRSVKVTAGLHKEDCPSHKSSVCPYVRDFYCRELADFRSKV